MLLDIMIKNITRQKIQNIEPFLEELANLSNYKIPSQISVLLCGDKTMKYLNSTYRKKYKTTDVLSFMAEMDGILGDIIISLPQAKKQAQNGLAQEIEMLLCHGFLHLLGYDHEKSTKDYKIMMDLQDQLLKLKTTELVLL